MHTVVLVSLVIVSLALIVVVLLQSSKSAGLSGAISGGAEQLFESKSTWYGFNPSPCNNCVSYSVLFISNRYYKNLIVEDISPNRIGWAFSLSLLNGKFSQ